MTQTLTFSVNDVITAAPSSQLRRRSGPRTVGLRSRSRLRPRRLRAGRRSPTPVTRPGQLPTAYQRMSDDELHARIRTAKEKLGSDLVILGHFYQRDEVVQYADFVGDSFQLANAALTRPEASTIVFCGVHFMAETADILARPDQHVILPNLAAGCSMADMADEDSVEAAWEELMEIYADEADADGPSLGHPGDLHELLGRAEGVLRPARRHRLHLVQRRHRAGVGLRAWPAGAVLPRPAPRPQHGQGDGRTAGAMPMWNPRKPLGGNTEAELQDAKVILWHGFCSVHKRFSVAQIEQARAEHPGCKVIVHPECPMPVVDAADASGSTDAIRKFVAAAEPG